MARRRDDDGGKGGWRGREEGKGPKCGRAQEAGPKCERAETGSALTKAMAGVCIVGESGGVRGEAGEG